LNDAEIYIDGFHRFTPQELLVIEELLKKCKRVSVTLTMDEITGYQVPELDLFYQTKDTYQKLVKISQENNILIDDPVVFQPENGQFKDRPAFFHLEENRSEEHTSELQSR